MFTARIAAPLPFFLGIFRPPQLGVGVGQGLVGEGELWQAGGGDFKVHRGGFVVCVFEEGGAHCIVRPGGVGLKLDGFVQVLRGFGVLARLGQGDSQRVLRQIESGIGGRDRLKRGDGMVGLGLGAASAASITLLAMAILSLGSVPVTMADAPADFCSPTYPSDASFCISDELSSAPEDFPASPVKRRSKLSSCAAMVSSVALELWARLRVASGSAVRS